MSLAGTLDDATYGLEDVIRLAVTFDKIVTVDGDSPPVLVLDCTRAREALFNDSVGNSTTLFFEYEVCSFWPLRPSNVKQSIPFAIDGFLVPGAPVSGPMARLARL